MLRVVALLAVASAATAGSAAGTQLDGDISLRLPSLEEREHAADDTATLCDPVKQYSGYFKLYPGKPGLSKNYFYWFFESRTSPSTDPVTLWMTGGPGCSSEVALFGENGPCSVNEGGNGTVHNPFSWNRRSNLLYIDQPTGTGFSYGLGLDHDEEQVILSCCSCSLVCCLDSSPSLGLCFSAGRQRHVRFPTAVL